MFLFLDKGALVIKPNFYNAWEKSRKILCVILSEGDFIRQSQYRGVFYRGFFEGAGLAKYVSVSK